MEFKNPDMHSDLVFNLYRTLILQFICLLFFGSVNAQISIPSKPSGFWYSEKSGDANSILIEAFFDPVCPDSRDSWPPLKQAIHHYGTPAISLAAYTFPLPYHDNAYLTSRALHIVNELNVSSTYKLLEAFFHHQDRFYGHATENFTRAHVRDQVANFAGEVVGRSYTSAIKLGFTQIKTDLNTRFAFKYGGIKGVYGIPFFFVNGFPLPDAGSAIDFQGWKKFLDPLIKNKKGKRGMSAHHYM